MARILVLYHSQEVGNTAAMANAVADGAQQAGADVESFNTNEHRLPMDTFAEADAVAFGSPDYFSYLAGGLKMFLDDWYIAREIQKRHFEKKPYGLFITHGGGGKVRGPMETLFRNVGEQVGEMVESKGPPDETTLDACRTLGRVLAEAVNGS